MRSRWEKILQENDLSWLEIEDFDYDQHKGLRAKYNIGRDIPVFIFFNSQGNEFARFVGEVDRKELIKFILENKKS